jgi:hypothetical protein
MTACRSTIAILISAFAVLLIACGSESTSDTAPAAQLDGADNGSPVDTGSGADGPDQTLAASEQRDAVIDSVDIFINEARPPQHVARVTVVQPNSCATFAHVSTGFDVYARLINTSAVNDVLVGPDVACDLAISTTEHEVRLGPDFEPGLTYTVKAGPIEFEYVPEGGSPVYSFDRFQEDIDDQVGNNEIGGPVALSLSSVQGQVLNIFDDPVQVYEFATIVEAGDFGRDVSEDQSIAWNNEPRVFRVANIVMIYDGTDERVNKALIGISKAQVSQRIDALTTTVAQGDLDDEEEMAVAPTDADEALDLFTCAGVLGSPAPGYVLNTRNATDSAHADNPDIQSMCTATWDRSVAGGEFLSVALITLSSNQAAADHFQLVASGLVDTPQVAGDSHDVGPEILGAVINQGGIGSIVISRDHRVLVSTHSGPETNSESVWNVDFLMETAASILEATPDSLRTD